MLSAVPTYFMSLYRLPKWVIKEIDRIRFDFLWTGPDIEHPGCRLMVWKNICHVKEQGGWGILDLSSFNLALLGKWRWKVLSDSHWGGVKILRFNYNVPTWDLFRLLKGRISFFWSGVSRCLPAFRGCVSVQVKCGAESLFWKDRWFNGLVPMYIWPDEFCASHLPNGTVRDLAFLLERPHFVNDLRAAQLLFSLNLAS